MNIGMTRELLLKGHLRRQKYSKIIKKGYYGDSRHKHFLGPCAYGNI